MAQTKIEKAVLLASAVLERLGLLSKGDILWHDGVGPTRLPVGSTGQALVVGASDALEWGTPAAGNPDYIIGEVRMFALAEANLPAGWIPCDGRELEEAVYSDLFGAIAYNFGQGATGYFKVPQMGGRAPAGIGTGADQQTTFTATSLRTGSNSDAVFATANNSLYTGRVIQINHSGASNPATTPPNALNDGTNVYIIRIDPTHVKFATTLANAVAGTNIVINSVAGIGTTTLVLSLADRALADIWGEDYHAMDVATGRSELPAHTHTYLNAGDVGSANLGSGMTAADETSGTTGSAGEGKEFNMCGPRIAMTFAIWTNYIP